jgi:BirA family transcriptional regulator, biotin operon repressor / biotin---[acetyl-CoA-carboxylase] ligase
MQPSPWTLERHKSVTSTMDVARERARAGAPHGTVVVAESMTAGRGTHGRPWASPEGGLYLSIVLRGLQDPHLLTLALGNAVAESLEVAGVEPRLKWVNDVLVDGKKMAGILVEGESTADRIDFLVAGIGINVNGKASALKGAESIATTLEDQLGCDSCIPDLETLLLDRVAHWVDRVRSGVGAEVVAAFASRDALQGRKVRVTSGKDRLEGVAQGIDARGHLRLATPSGERTVLAGDLDLLA